MESNFFKLFIKRDKVFLANSCENVEDKVEYKPIERYIIDLNAPDFETKERIRFIEREGQFINYHGDDDFFERSNIKNHGEQTYVISECNNKNKYSKRYSNCIGLVAVGESKKSKDNISILSHQGPHSFLHRGKEEFTRDLIESVKEIISKSKEGSVNIVLFGGKTRNGDEYEKSIEFVCDILLKEFNIKPKILTGPNDSSAQGPTNAYFDNQNRLLYIERPRQFNKKMDESYSSDELEERKEEWHKGEEWLKEYQEINYGEIHKN